MTRLRVAVYPGDGIGPEVTTQAVRVLEAVADRHRDVQLDFQWFRWGMDYHRRHGTVVPPDYLEHLSPCAAILLGAVGWPAELPDHVTLAPLVKIRQRFDQYACVRPARLLPGVPPCWRAKVRSEIDFVVIRENSEGEYVDLGRPIFSGGRPTSSPCKPPSHTRRGVERILRYGFELARARRKRLTMVTKSNAQRYAYVLWDEVLEEISRRSIRDVTADRQHATPRS